MSRFATAIPHQKTICLSYIFFLLLLKLSPVKCGNFISFFCGIVRDKHWQWKNCLEQISTFQWSWCVFVCCVYVWRQQNSNRRKKQTNKKGRESGTLNFRSNRTVYVRTVFNVLAVVARGIDCVTWRIIITLQCVFCALCLCVCCCDSTLIPNILDSNDFKHLHNWTRYVQNSSNITAKKFSIQQFRNQYRNWWVQRWTVPEIKSANHQSLMCSERANEQ